MPESPRILVLFGGVVLFGAERGNLEALSALQERGASILCLISDERWNTIVPGALDARGFAWRKVPYVQIGRGIGWRNLLWENPRRFVAANRAFLRAVREFRPTHIHAYGQPHIANFAWGLMRTHLPLVFRAGDEPTLHSWLWRLVWRFAAWRAARFVANSEFVARSLRASGVAADKITVTYNVPPSRQGKTVPAPDLKLPAGVRVFAYIGQIAEHKGPHVLVEAFRQVITGFPETHLFLAGRISDWEGDAWGRALRDATRADPLIGDKVTFLGEIDDVASLLDRCDALVVPSLFDDPSPNVVMEAKQAGRAVIAFPRGGLPELVKNNVDGLLCRDATTEALADALTAYLADPALARKHGAAAAAASERFGAPRFGASWQAVYAAAAGDVDRAPHREGLLRTPAD